MFNFLTLIAPSASSLTTVRFLPVELAPPMLDTADGDQLVGAEELGSPDLDDLAWCPNNQNMARAEIIGPFSKKKWLTNDHAIITGSYQQSKLGHIKLDLLNTGVFMDKTMSNHIKIWWYWNKGRNIKDTAFRFSGKFKYVVCHVELKVVISSVCK